MSMENVGKLVDRWIMDAGFRAALRKDPEGTIKTCGVSFTAEEMAAFRGINWKMSDEELKTRANKLFA